ncbi:MAG: hypothetical protein R3244_06635, partial [Thermoanaerobaculia bacterium]|nr:hypothetical protein [Thermoanaerobaculia bacterium]
MSADLVGLVGLPGVVLGLVALVLLALQSRPLGRRLWPLLAVVSLTVAALVALAVLRSPTPLGPTWLERARVAYDTLWSELDDASLEGAAALETFDLTGHDRLDLFHRLERLAERLDVTLLLLDPSGESFAWAGDGLLHSLDGEPIPSTGPVFLSSFSAVTLGSVRRVGLQPAAWRLLAGRSYSSQRLPFASPSGGRRGDFVWAVAPAGSRLPSRSTAVDVEGRPTMALLPAPDRPYDGSSRRTALLEMGWLGLGLGWLVLGGRRRDRGDLMARPERGALLTIGLLALAVAAGTSALHTALLAGALALLWASLYASPAIGWRPAVLLAAPAALALVAAVAFRLEKVVGPENLASGPLMDVEGTVLRLAVLAIALAGLLPAFRGRRSSPFERHALVPATFCLGGLAVVATNIERLGLAAVTLAVAAAAAAVWVGAARASGSSRAFDLLLAVTLAALLGATTWHLMHRYLQARYLERDIAPLMGAPIQSERAALSDSIDAYFEDLDLSELSAVEPWGLEAIDLAYALWVRSPLAVEGRLSSLTVLVDGVPLSSFEFGVPTDASGAVDRSPIVWQELVVPGWEDALLSGVAPLSYGGATEGTVRWALLPRPGFRLVDEPIEQLAATLVRGTLSRQLPINERIAPAEFAVYAERPRPSLGPSDAPALDREVLARPHFEVERDGRTIEGWTRSGDAAVEVLLLPESRARGGGAGRCGPHAGGRPGGGGGGGVGGGGN